MSQYEAYLVQISFHDLKFLTLLVQSIKSIGSNFPSLLRRLHNQAVQMLSISVNISVYFRQLLQVVAG